MENFAAKVYVIFNLDKRCLKIRSVDEANWINILENVNQVPKIELIFEHFSVKDFALGWKLNFFYTHKLKVDDLSHRNYLISVS